MELTLDQALKQAVAAHKKGKLQDAERLYRAILQSQPNHPDANHNLGVLAVAVGKPLEAVPFFKQALDANPQIEQFWLSYVDALVKSQRFEQATRVIVDATENGVAADKLDIVTRQLPQAQANDTKKIGQHVAPLKSKEGLAAGRKGRSRKASGSLTTAEPPQRMVNNLLQNYQAGRIHEAEQLAASMTEEFPQTPLGWKVLGSIKRQTGRLKESMALFEKCLSLAPRDAESMANLGNVFRQLGRLADAEISYSQALSIKDDVAEFHSNLGLVLEELGRLDEAERSHRRAIALKPSLSQGHYNLGVTLKKLGRLTEAASSYARAIELRPEDSRAHFNLGNTLKVLGRRDEAEACYTRAISLKPESHKALSGRSYLLLEKGEYQAALEDADACKLNKKDKALPLAALFALGRIDEIYERLAIHSKVDPENISLAAFSAFLSKVEGRATRYNFCPDPLEFIHLANLSSHVCDSGAYMEDLIEELNEVETSWEPLGKTTVGGFQSSHEVNLFKNPTPKIALLKSIIVSEIEAYLLEYNDDRCLFIKNFPNTRNLRGWTVTLKQQGHQKSHIHPNGWLSGVIYLKVVPSLGKNEGAIEFSLNGTHYRDDNSPEARILPNLGDLIFFPSSLHHKTIPFTTNSERMIVSFDLMPRTSD